MCVVVFLFSFTVLCVICCARVFLFFVRACLYHCDVYLADVGRILYINGYYFILLFFVRACLYHCDVYLADVGRILYINGYYFIFLAYTNVCSVTELT